MNRRFFGMAIVTLLLGVNFPVEAQQQKKIPRVGYLGVAPATTLPRADALRQGLRQLGYTEGKDFAIEYGYAEGKLDRLTELAAELVALKVDVIVTGNATRSAKQATVTIPIVMAYDADPVGSGFVASLARPGGNITGLSSLAPEISGKRLELLKEIVPKLSRLAVFGDSTFPGNAQALRETELAARAIAVQLQYIDERGHKDVESLFRAASQGRPNAVLVLPSPVLFSQRTQTAELAVKSHLPATYPGREFVEDGGLTSYGVSEDNLFRRAANYVDKILKGAKPADLPVEEPMKFELNALLVRWGHLHWAGTVTSGAAFIVCLVDLFRRA